MIITFFQRQPLPTETHHALTRVFDYDKICYILYTNVMVILT